MNIGLFTNTKNGKVLQGKRNTYTDEFIAKREKYYLSDYLVKNSKGGIDVYYQFHTKNYTTLNDTMAFDIECPKCHTYLKINKLGSNGHDHSWYYCPRCRR